MKTNLALRTLGRLWLLAAALCSASFNARAQIDDSTAEMLMRKSGLWVQMGEMSQQVRKGFEASTAASPKPPSADEQARLSRVIANAYAADRLRRVALQSLARLVQPAQVDSLRKWFNSSLGESLTKLEEAAAASQTDPAMVMREGHALLEALPSVRRAQYNEMVEVTKAPEFAVELMVNAVVAIQRGVQAAQPSAPAAPPADIKALLEAQRPALLRNYAALFMASSALTYKDVPAADFSSYLAFLKSDAGRHFNDAVLAAMGAALTDASVELGRGLPATKDAANS